jgi:hypothetical protein
MPKKIVSIALVIILGFSWIAMAGSKSVTQLTPIDLGEAGNSAVLEVHVTSISGLMAKGNPTILALQIVAPRKGQEELLGKFENLIMSLTGTRYGVLSEQEIARPLPHREVKLHVAWRDKHSGTILKEGDVSTGHDWQGKVRAVAGVSFTLDSIDLPVGSYEVTVTTLSNDPRFDGTFETGLCTGTIFE